MSLIEIDGFCPICQLSTRFSADSEWYRDSLRCGTCDNGSLPRERALAKVLDEIRPAWRDCAIHESSPAGRGISLKMKRDAKGYVGTQYFPGVQPGLKCRGVRNEDLHSLTFADGSHDIFVSLDVFEHLPHPDRALAEIYRTLKPGGVMLSTFPVRSHQTTGAERRVDYGSDGAEIHLKPVEIHGNPVSAEGSIVTVDYGYDLHKQFALWAPFDVEVRRFCDKTHGILGEFTEVVICRKPAAPITARPRRRWWN